MEINIIPKFLDSAMTPVAKEAGERLADIVSILFTPIIKAKAKRDKNIEIFLKELDKKVGDIPEEKLQEPPLNIVGPALDNVFKFYHDEEHIRHMYSTLIASSMYSDNQVSPSYIDIIRQLSHYDAVILSTLLKPLQAQSNIRFISVPVLTIELQYNCGIDDYIQKTEMVGLMYYLSEEMRAFYIDSLTRHSLDSLERLGLIRLRKEKASYSILEEYGIEVENNRDSLLVYLCQISLTNFGISFLNTCCDSAGTRDCLKSNEYLKKIIIKKDGFSLLTENVKNSL